MLIHNTALTMRGKSPNWLLGVLIPTTYILGGIKKGLLCSINVMAGRGCIFKCSFCTGNKIFNPNKNCPWRVKSPDDVIEEINDLLYKYWKYENLYEIINFCDLNFVNETPKGLHWIDEFTNTMGRTNLDIFFYIMTRVDSIVNQKERIIKLRDCGLVQIEMGLEAGTENGLSVYNKKITVNQSHEAIKFLRKNKIDFGMSGFIMYHPYICLDELRQNAKFLKVIEYWKVMFLLTKMALYPGSDITKEVKESKLLNDTFCHYEVYDYRFADEKVERLYNNIAMKLPFDVLNGICESVNYIELQVVITYRKIEKISHNNKKILELIKKKEKNLKKVILDSKNLIHDFFYNSIDLSEKEWNELEFDKLISVFTANYIRSNDFILKEYEIYGDEIERIIGEIQ